MRSFALAALALITALSASLPAQAGRRLVAQNDVSSEEVTTLTTRPRKDPRLWKVRISPLSGVLSDLIIDASARVGRSAWTVGGVAERNQMDVQLWKFDSYGAGLTSSWFASGSPFEDSWYISPSLMYRWGTLTEDVAFYATQGDFRIVSLETIFGYQWHWDNFNIGLGLGGMVGLVEVKNVRGKVRLFSESSFEGDGSSASEVAAALTGEFKMGLSF